MRNADTLEDPEVWYETDQYFAQRLLMFLITFTTALVQSWKHMQLASK